ncbi:hypothetical protein Fmac_026347 [Flemingia macrophylla]|uniref:ABC transporter domain-containing protein n=1 Tax=Flemingia macrophylla TaxID=520843 RepID=A0ABD1LEV2_9FABA
MHYKQALYFAAAHHERDGESRSCHLLDSSQRASPQESHIPETEHEGERSARALPGDPLPVTVWAPNPARHGIQHARVQVRLHLQKQPHSLLRLRQALRRSVFRQQSSRRMPRSQTRPMAAASLPFPDLPDASCRTAGSCPLTLLFTAENHSLAETVTAGMYGSAWNVTDFGSDIYAISATHALGSDSEPGKNDYIEPAFSVGGPIYYLQRNCSDVEKSGFYIGMEHPCMANNHKCNLRDAFDTLAQNDLMISNSYLQFLLGPVTKMLFEFVKEMPKPESSLRLDLSSLLGALFFTWVILQLFPQQKLRIMMKMHGLGDGPYWMISYGYFLAISVTYMSCFVIFGSLLGGWIIVMELYPGFALYRGLYEFGQFSFDASLSENGGMKWQNLSESTNGMKEKKTPLPTPDTEMQVSKVFSHMDKRDVIQEMEKVEELLLEPTINHAIVCDNLQKVYPGRDGNPDKFAVRGLYLSVPQGECFGMLGPNGAGKTSFINMMIGLEKPSSGAAFVQGLDIRTQMDGIYTTMGVCPQYDLLWESLTGREHLLFYGRLKNLKDSALTQAVEEYLKSLNLFHGGVADKQAGNYSGGMKRRLSVAISLIGDPRVIYMDEPSRGLDPASRKSLWNVVKHAKQNRAIILTTHSMEEAEALCDRLGIFVNGSLQCVGNPKELKARYGGTYVFTMTTSSDHEKDVENMVQRLTPNANKIYHLSGTQKFELPKEDVKIGDVFQAVDAAKRNFTVSAWGLVDTTLEDVFIKVAREAQAFETLS